MARRCSRVGAATAIGPNDATAGAEYDSTADGARLADAGAASAAPTSWNDDVVVDAFAALNAVTT